MKVDRTAGDLKDAKSVVGARLRAAAIEKATEYLEQLRAQLGKPKDAWLVTPENLWYLLDEGRLQMSEIGTTPEEMAEFDRQYGTERR
jgi:hypothetical protein